MDEHVRIELLDPKWREQKAKAAEKNATSNLLSGSVISDNLKRISAFRTDIFEGDETSIVEKVKELKQQAKEKEERVWDGHSATVTAVTQKVLSNVDIEAQLKQALQDEERKLGPVDPFAPKLSLPLPSAVPPPPPPTSSFAYPPPMPSQMNSTIPSYSNIPSAPSAYSVPLASSWDSAGYHPPAANGMAPPPPPGSYMNSSYGQVAEEQPDLPPAKRQKTEPTRPGFIPEDHFMKMAKPFVTLNISIGSLNSGDISKYGWTFSTHGASNVLELAEVTPATLISEIKDKIAKLTKMPTPKQKLTLYERSDQRTGAVYSDRVVMKDGLTAAYYNLTPGDTIELGLRERGGKK
ncbi:hypothetical protein HDV05_000275 [Chytridiales sp. JEL 0842]|nr:hypothetical protein HDV05_000275 [Chytridiales sp. JEL 0842]